ncbi:MAG: GntR family transcriptional regulator [Oscillospiraceae bacterium]|nr:GntR family transcriptional regulator [Oscillospiraceae bacterium]MBR4194611.1 GntR family transcriptional regulator [Oscillospiraceae bacterium]
MISLNYRDPRPIYEQLEEKLRRLILSGAIGEGERLPSVRELAAQLAINPNTIQRAYRELEQAGFIYSVPGKGSFAGKLSGVDEGRRKELREKLTAIWTELLQLGEDPEQLHTLLKESVGADAHIGPVSRNLPANEGGCGHPPLQGEAPETEQTLLKEVKTHD